MPAIERDEAERKIERALVEEWDPLGVHETPGTHPEYGRYASEIYGLLARGGSDVQVARFLRRVEHDDFGGPPPEDPTRDLSRVLRTLRSIERTI